MLPEKKSFSTLASSPALIASEVVGVKRSEFGRGGLGIIGFTFTSLYWLFVHSPYL